MKMNEHGFAVCINNKGYETSLEFGVIYQVVIEKDAEGLIRIIDESGEDYGYELKDFTRSICRRLWKKPYCTLLEYLRNNEREILPNTD